MDRTVKSQRVLFGNSLKWKGQPNFSNGNENQNSLRWKGRQLSDLDKENRNSLKWKGQPTLSNGTENQNSLKSKKDVNSLTWKNEIETL